MVDNNSINSFYIMGSLDSCTFNVCCGCCGVPHPILKKSQKLLEDGNLRNLKTADPEMIAYLISEIIEMKSS